MRNWKASNFLCSLEVALIELRFLAQEITSHPNALRSLTWKQKCHRCHIPWLLPPTPAPIMITSEWSFMLVFSSGLIWCSRPDQPHTSIDPFTDLNGD